MTECHFNIWYYYTKAAKVFEPWPPLNIYILLKYSLYNAIIFSILKALKFHNLLLNNRLCVVYVYKSFYYLVLHNCQQLLDRNIWVRALHYGF
jgi:hypothetical protein